MGNQSGNAYGLSALFPIRAGSQDNTSFDKRVLDQLQCWPQYQQSPLARVPNTYLARFYILDDVFYQGHPAREEHLKNKYLVFSSNFYGELETYLIQMWQTISDELKQILQYCVAFEKVDSEADFVDYVKRCQVENSLFFNGSNDLPLARQLKDLCLKQAFAKFAVMAQSLSLGAGADPVKLKAAFTAFSQKFTPKVEDGISLLPGAVQFPGDIDREIAAIFAELK